MSNKMHFLIIISVLLLMTCIHDNDSESSYDILLIITDKFGQPSNSFTQNEPITLELKIHNITGRAITIFTGDGCTANFEIFDSENISLGPVPRFCLAVTPTETKLQPGDTFSEIVSWDQTTSTPNSTILNLGDYIIVGSVSGLDKSSTMSISIL